MNELLNALSGDLVVARGTLRESKGEIERGFDSVFTDCALQPIGRAIAPMVHNKVIQSSNVRAKVGRTSLFQWRLEGRGSPVERKYEHVFEVVSRIGGDGRRYVGLERVDNWVLASSLFGRLQCLKRQQEAMPASKAFEQLSSFVASAFSHPHFNSVGARVPVRTIQKALDAACAEYGLELVDRIRIEKRGVKKGFA